MMKWLTKTFFNKATVANYPCLEHSALFDWWQEERQAITQKLREEYALLKQGIDKEIDYLDLVVIEERLAFEKDSLTPQYETWFTQTYQRYSYGKDLVEFGKISGKHKAKPNEFDLRLKRSEWMKLSAMRSSTFAHLIALPVAGGAVSLSSGMSLFGLTIIAPAVTVAFVPSLIAVTALSTFAAGQFFKSKNKPALAKAYKDKIAQSIELSVFGDPEKPEIESLRDILIKELDILFDLKLHRLEEGQL